MDIRSIFMNIQDLIPTVTSMGGGFFIGIMFGYFVKKIIKILMFIAGGVVGLLLYLQQQQIISVNIEKLEAASTFILTLVTSSFDKMTQIGDGTTLGITLAGGFSAGVVIGITRG